CSGRPLRSAAFLGRQVAPRVQPRWLAALWWFFLCALLILAVTTAGLVGFREGVRAASPGDSNPKIGAFFVAFLPGFIPAGVPVREFSILLGAWFAVETAIWLGVVVWMVDRGVGWLSRSGVRRNLERLTGVVLIGLGF